MSETVNDVVLLQVAFETWLHLAMEERWKHLSDEERTVLTNYYWGQFLEEYSEVKKSNVGSSSRSNTE